MISIRAFIDRLGIAEHPGLRISPRLEGYRDYTFGCRAGPGRASVRNLAHELAHAAEFGAAAFSRRCFMSGFCLQLHLLQHAGERVNALTFARHAADIMVRFMHDWWQFPGDTEQDRKHWCAQQVLDHHARTSAEATIAEIKAWLGATDRRLSRQKRKGASE